MLPTIVDVERQTDELRENGGAARPGLDRRTAASILRSFRLLQQMQVHERTFPYGAGHCLPLLLRVTRPDNHLVGRFVITSARTLRRLTPRGDRMPTTSSPARTPTMRVVHRVLSNAPRYRAPPLPAAPARFPILLVALFRV